MIFFCSNVSQFLIAKGFTVPTCVTRNEAEKSRSVVAIFRLSL